MLTTLVKSLQLELFSCPNLHKPCNGRVSVYRVDTKIGQVSPHFTLNFQQQAVVIKGIDHAFECPSDTKTQCWVRYCILSVFLLAVEKLKISCETMLNRFDMKFSYGQG